MNRRKRYLVKMAAGTDRLAGAASRGDQRRYADAYGRLWTELPDTIQAVNDDLDLLLAS